MTKNSAKQHRKSGKKHVKKTMKGGEGTSDHALKVFGGMNEQHAVSAIDNTIATNAPAAMQGGNVVEKIASLQNEIFGKDTMGGNAEWKELQNKINGEVAKLEKEGGEEMKQKMNDLNEAVQNGGTGVLENIAVPAILLYANQNYSSKKRFAHGKAKLRRTARRVRKMRK